MASEVIVRYLEVTPSAQHPASSGLAFRYFATQHARQPGGSAPQLPTHATYSQLQVLDGHIEAANQNQTAVKRVRVSAYKTIRVRINGGDVNFEFNMSGLQDALGLPDFDLRPPGPIDTTIADLQGEDMEDVDHMATDSMSLDQ